MTRRTRRRVYVAAVAAVFGVSSPLWAPPLLGTLPIFRVREVKVLGTRFADPAAVLRRADIGPDASVWDDPSAWEARIRAHPLVREARVRRTGMHSLEIKVVEVQPVALVPTPTLMAVDREGRVLPIDPAEQRLDLPVLSAPVQVKDGRITGNECRHLLDILSRLATADPGFPPQVSELWLRRDGTVEVRMLESAAAGRVLLDSSDPVLGLRRVELALESLGPDHRVAAADARFEGQVVLKPKGGA